MQPVQLLVYPNPWHHLDAEGHPAGAYPFDPDHAQGSRRVVGAQIDPARTGPIQRPWDWSANVKVAGAVRRMTVNAAPDKRIVWLFDLREPTVLPDLPHYWRGLREGSLLPADEATAAHVGVPFVPKQKAFEAAVKAALALWNQSYGGLPPLETWPAYLRLGAAAPTTASEAS